MSKRKESIDLQGFVVGEAYTKHDIVQVGNVSAPTSFNAGGWRSGILSFHNAALLLVTLDKGQMDANYEDYFDGDEIHWQSQNRHSQESPFILGLSSGEVDARLFARLKGKVSGKTQPFIYCGRLAWASLEGGNYPVSCRLKLLDRPQEATSDLQALYDWRPSVPQDTLGRAILETTIDAAKSMAAVNTEEDARDLMLRAVAVRRGQRSFRKKLLAAYQRRCVVTDCAVAEILEAAHIVPYKGAHTHRLDNGLLLRSDIHTLFDLGLLWIHQDYTVQLAEYLRDGEYGYLHGKPLRQPARDSDAPKVEHLAHHAKLSFELREAQGKARIR